jgi:hypothetical protein
MSQIFCWFGLILFFTALAGAGLAGSWFYYQKLPVFSRAIPETRNRGASAWRLMCPGWWVLYYFPFWGKKWFDEVLNLAQRETSLCLPFETQDLMAEDNVIKGGACILISEFYERTSGLAHGMRLHILSGHTSLVSSREQTNSLSPHAVRVYTARPLEREWAVIQASPGGNSFILKPRNAEYVIAIFADGRLTFCPVDGHRLSSGDRFAIDISEFEFLQLPRLVLLNAEGKEIYDLEEEEAFERKEGAQNLIIRGGKLSMEDSISYRPIKESARGETLMNHVLQPGDRFVFGQEEWLVTYSIERRAR